MKLCTSNPDLASDCGCNKNRMPDINISIQNNNESKADTGQRTTAAPYYAPYYAPETNAAASYKMQPRTNSFNEAVFPTVTNIPSLPPTVERTPIVPAYTPQQQYVAPSSPVMPVTPVEIPQEQQCVREFLPLGLEWF